VLEPSPVVSDLFFFVVAFRLRLLRRSRRKGASASERASKFSGASSGSHAAAVRSPPKAAAAAAHAPPNDRRASLVHPPASATVARSGWTSFDARIARKNSSAERFEEKKGRSPTTPSKNDAAPSSGRARGGFEKRPRVDAAPDAVVCVRRRAVEPRPEPLTSELPERAPR
jgi:hypothetical protein